MARASTRLAASVVEHAAEEGVLLALDLLDLTERSGIGRELSLHGQRRHPGS